MGSEAGQSGRVADIDRPRLPLLTTDDVLAADRAREIPE